MKYCKTDLKQATKEELNQQVKEIRMALSELNMVHRALQTHLSVVYKEIHIKNTSSDENGDVEDELKTDEANITDHALIRYLERVKGHKFDNERNEIKNIVRTAVKYGAPFVVSNKFRYVIRDNSVITVLDKRYRFNAFNNLDSDENEI